MEESIRKLEENRIAEIQNEIEKCVKICKQIEKDLLQANQIQEDMRITKNRIDEFGKIN